MKLWSLILKVLLFPGQVALHFAPEMGDEAKRLLFHMANYIFWLTPTIGLVIWLVIRHALARA